MPIHISDIRQAKDNIAARVKETAVLTNASLDLMSSAALFFKCENFQKTGSFKIRGACNAVSRLSQEAIKHGIVTHSSGNHGAAIAQAARWRGAKCYVVTPHNSPQIKQQSLFRYGAEVSYSDATVESRTRETEKIVEKTGAVIIHPFDNDDVIAGAGTAALELLQTVPDLDVIIAPIGGGGLLSGTSIAAKSMRPSIQVIGAEPSLADDAYESFYHKELHPQREPKTIADGLRASLCERTFNIIMGHVDKIVTATDEEILSAMFLIWQRMKIIVEPSAAVTLAVALKIKDQLPGKKTGLILSGGNVDFKDMLAYA